MKETLKKKLLISLFIVLLFIPSYIAIASYYSDEQSKYDISIITDNDRYIKIPSRTSDKLAKSILHISSRLQSADKSSVSLPSKYYSITIKENEKTISSMKWYLIASKGSDSYATDKNGNIYVVKYSDAKTLLANSFASYFYDNSSLPVLSISGGSDIVPIKASWLYREIEGSMISSPEIATSSDAISYSINEHACIYFSTEPQRCSITLYDQYGKTENYTSLDALPMLEAGSMIKINAYWNDNDNKGSAQYKFYVKEWNAPIYSIDDNTISAGEFFAVRVKNVDAPHKIEFSSIPEIHAEPIFYSDRDGAFALIPIKKELAAPCNYTFSFKYGTDIQKIPVSVEPRAIRDDKKCHVSIPLTDNELNNIYKIFSDTSLRSENADKFIDKLLDYSPDNTGSAKLAEVYYGFGHTIIPTNGFEPYRLDGVIYIFPDGADIPAVGKGKVLCAETHPLIGNYVAVDHGMGLITWYCNMSEIKVSLGDEVNIGTSVGASGDTGFDGINGVYFITTVNGVPISPYPLQ